MAPIPSNIGNVSRSLSLHARAMMALLAALAVAAGLGGGLAVWHAQHSVAAELHNAMSAGDAFVREELRERAGARLLIGAFDGERHVRLSQLDARGVTLASSRPAQSRTPPPDWFVRLFDPRLPPVAFPAPDGSRLVLSAEPVNEIGEVWIGFGDILLIGGLTLGLALVLVYLALARALRPLDDVSTALGRVGEGDFSVRVAERGAPEVGALASGFNVMARRLDEAEHENLRLQQQLLTVQEEERADLARDLHDDVGPYLFAVGLDAAAVRDLARGRQWRAVAGRADLIQSAVGHVQGHVRDMLDRLRPARAVEFGLAPAVEELVAFWRSRRPQTHFEAILEADEAALSLAEREALYRVAQEALTNAVRHGEPSRISLRLGRVARGAELQVRDDGRAGRRSAARARYGLMGMRERLDALGGELAVEPGPEGWSVAARVPGAHA